MAFHPDITPKSREDTAAGLAQLALSKAKKQQTRKSGSTTWHNDNGTRTVIGPDAGTSGIAPWVGDTTPPGIPTGVGVDSAAGMILVSWDGTLKGGLPADFDHVQILVDGVEAGQLRVRGTATLGPYEADSVHRVTVRAWDDAHAEDGSPAPNGSEPTKPVSVTVKSVVDASEIQAAQDKAQQAINQIAGVRQTASSASQVAADAGKAAASAGSTASQAKTIADGKNRIIAAASEPSHDGLALGDLWMQLDKTNNVVGIQVWNGKSFVDYVLLAQQVLVAGSVGTICLADGAVVADKVTASEALLEKLLVRKIKADEIDVGMLTAAIVKSKLFTTPDGLVGFNPSGFWAKDKDGALAFQAGSAGVRMTGDLETSKGGDRLRVGRRYLPSLGRTVGAVEGLQDDASKWALTGFYDQSKTEVQLSANGHTPSVWLSSPAEPDKDLLVLTSHEVDIGATRQVTGSTIDMDAQHVTVQGLPADYQDYDPASYLGWWGNWQDYNHATRLYKRGGVIFLELNITYIPGLIPANQTIPAVLLASSIMPDHSLDVLAYGTSYAVGRFHVFGPNEGQPQGTISIGTRDTSANFFSSQMCWAAS